MSILQNVLATIKKLDECTIAIEDNHIYILASTPRYIISASTPIPATGSGLKHVYATSDLLEAIKQCTRISEVSGTLNFYEEVPGYTTKATIQPKIHPPIPALPTLTYTTTIHLSPDTLKRILPLLKETEVSLYLAEGILYLTAATPESDDILKITDITILKEGTDKVTIPFALLKLPLPLLPDCQQVYFMYNSTHFALFLAITPTTPTTSNQSPANDSHYTILTTSLSA
ncbi:hypothetical protein NEHOM01_1270 [Nematocida homosporus]|uniref:uncharacterized protein n=1 Tax=Nematocida homosporus TaxID=1912981 RepID=UPI00221F8DFB|nr:uncharacterized protein NEHOM01_1270 [Nematocida homosporus]KAI5186088.1 hypothetical protein NEHOM01_1270 [Nematocida homosporus]